MDTIGLPPGVDFRPAACPIITELTYSCESARQAYQHLTGPSERLDLSLYLLEHWLPEWGPESFTYVVKLQNLARKWAARGSREPLALTLDQYAEQMGVSRSTFKRWVKALNSPGEVDGLRWESLRLYVQFRETQRGAGRGRRNMLLWSFRVLLGDVLHPKHMDSYARLQQYGEAAFPGAEQRAILAPAIEPETCREGVHFDRQNDPPTLQECPNAPLPGQNDPPTPPQVAVGANTFVREAGQNDGQNDPPKALEPKPIKAGLRPVPVHQHPTPENRPQAADWPACLEKLRSLGIDQDRIAYLESLDDHQRWTGLWLEWLPHVLERRTTGDRVRSAGGWVLLRILGACRGVDRDQLPPKEYLQAQEEARRKERGRQLVRRPAAAPVRTTTPAATTAPEVRPLWDRLRQEIGADSMLGAYLAPCRPVSLEGRTLTVDTGSKTSTELLARHRGAILDAAHRAGLDLADVTLTNGKDL